MFDQVTKESSVEILIISLSLSAEESWLTLCLLKTFPLIASKAPETTLPPYYCLFLSLFFSSSAQRLTVGMAQSLIWSFTVFHLHFLPRWSSPNHGFHTISTFLMLSFISGALTSPLSSMYVYYCSNSRIIAVSACWLLLIILLRLFTCTCVCEHMFLFLWPMSGIAWLCGKFILHFKEITKLFSKAAASWYIPTSNVWGFPFLSIIVNTCYCLSF